MSADWAIIRDRGPRGGGLPVQRNRHRAFAACERHLIKVDPCGGLDAGPDFASANTDRDGFGLLESGDHVDAVVDAFLASALTVGTRWGAAGAAI